MKKIRVLIVEDDKNVAFNLAKGLNENGIEVEIVHNGQRALEMVRMGYYNVLVVDRMLPKLDGLSMIKALRAENNHIPALMLTALGDIDDKVEALENGVDDYMAKPFAIAELLARIKILTKRHIDTVTTTSLEIGELHLDKLKRIVTREGQTITLQPKEFDLLVYMVEHHDQPITRKMLLKDIWGFDFDPQTNVVDVHISRLRNKIDKDFRDPMIKTVRGIGYILSSSKF
ncbi:MAG: response regulator transcription factor [Ostreibacterium sp.]